MFREKSKINESMKMSAIKKAEEGLKVCGKVRLIGHNKDGSLAFDFEKPNLITNVGYDLVCNVIGLASQPNEVAWMALGTGVAGDATATTLTAETHRSAATYAHVTGTKIFKFTATFTTVAAATEYGLLNAASVGVLFNIAGFAAITVDSLQIETTITLS